jgi:hypothetical protein
MYYETIKNQPMDAVDKLIPIYSLVKLRVIHIFNDIKVEKVARYTIGHAGSYYI